MFRITQFMQEIARPTPLTPKRHPPGPVVIWNLVRRCNLACKHCYSISADTDFPGELTTKEVFTVVDDLRRFGVPVLILSGGEPLLRPDIYVIARYAKDMGFYIAFGGALTFKNAVKQRAIAEKLPLERIVVETDCPYMTPEPHRGERNDPRLMRLTLEMLASVRGISAEEAAEATFANAMRLYRIEL